VAPNQNAESRIDRLLSEGKRFYLVANDDCHNVASAYCKTASVKVFSDNLTIADIMANLKSGNFYASSGANISRIEVLNQTIRIKTDAASKIEFIGDQGMVLQSGNGITSADYAVRGNEKYIRARVVRNSDGKMAWTNPIYISGANQAPTGYFDYAKCDNFAGWACDADDYSKTLEVHFYYDGPVGSGKFAGSVTANAAREAAVGNECGGNTAHGFKMPPPDFLKDGQSHTIYAYAINTREELIHYWGRAALNAVARPIKFPGARFAGPMALVGPTTIRNALAVRFVMPEFVNPVRVALPKPVPRWAITSAGIGATVAARRSIAAIVPQAKFVRLAIACPIAQAARQRDAMALICIGTIPAMLRKIWRKTALRKTRSAAMVSAYRPAVAEAEE
jgi:hypothetical protein